MNWKVKVPQSLSMLKGEESERGRELRMSVIR
jgi:hypothetical protein